MKRPLCDASEFGGSFAEDVLLDFAGGGSGERAEDDGPGDFVVGQIPSAVSDQFLFGD